MWFSKLPEFQVSLIMTRYFLLLFTSLFFRIYYLKDPCYFDSCYLNMWLRHLTTRNFCPFLFAVFFVPSRFLLSPPYFFLFFFPSPGAVMIKKKYRASLMVYCGSNQFRWNLFYIYIYIYTYTCLWCSILYFNFTSCSSGYFLKNLQINPFTIPRLWHEFIKKKKIHSYIN